MSKKNVNKVKIEEIYNESRLIMKKIAVHDVKMNKLYLTEIFDVCKSMYYSLYKKT